MVKYKRIRVHCLKLFLLWIVWTCMGCSFGSIGKDKNQAGDTSEDIQKEPKGKGADTNNLYKTVTTEYLLSNEKSNRMILVSAGQMLPCADIRIDGCDFVWVVSGNDIIYLSTNDRRFTTPEGYRVGTEFLELPDDIQHSLSKEEGWGYYYTLPSGWSLGFCEGISCTDHYPTNASMVKWIFKRP